MQIRWPLLGCKRALPTDLRLATLQSSPSESDERGVTQRGATRHPLPFGGVMNSTTPSGARVKVAIDSDI
jgi:hypothetical protein